MESERPIEKLLRAFAKKRREQAGAPFELSAEARRRLLREVQRQHDEPEEKRGFFSLAMPLPRLAFVLSVVAIVALLAAMLLPALSKAKSKAQRTSVLAQRRQAELQREMAREEMAAPAPATAPVASAAPARTLGEERTSDVFVTNSLHDFVVANGGVSGKLSSDRLDQSQLAFDGVAKTDMNLALNVPSNAVVLYSLGATPQKYGDATSAATMWGLAAQPDSGVYTAYAAPSNGLGRFYRSRTLQNSPTQGLSAVLAAFEFRVNGTNVRVLDRDGSLYEGTLKSYAGLSVSAGQTKIVADDKPLTHGVGGEFSFQVEGTNRTLNRPIVFAGKLLAPTNAPVSSPSTTTVTGHPPSAQTEPWPGKLDISGILTIDGKQTEIQAAPVAP